MLSVRNLAKIASRSPKKSPDGAVNGEEAQQSFLGSSVARSHVTPSRSGMRSSLRYQALPGSPAAPLSDGAITERDDEEEQQQCRCPTPGEIYVDAKETVREWRRVFKEADEVLNVGGWPC